MIKIFNDDVNTGGLTRITSRMAASDTNNKDVAKLQLSDVAPARGANSSEADKETNRGEGNSGASSSDLMSQLKRQIAELQKQLQQEQQQLQKIQSSQQAAELKAAAVGAVQTQISSTSAALQTVMAALLQAVKGAGSENSGNMVNVTA